MKTSNLMESVLQRFNTPLPGLNRVGRSARTLQVPRPPSDQSLRAGNADTLPHARSFPPARPTPGLTVATPSSLRSEAPDAARQRLHAAVLKAADQVGWLCSLQKDVEDQTTRVRDRLIEAEKELAGKQQAAGLRQQPEVRPAELRIIQEQVAMLSWWHDALGERQQEVAQTLQEARNNLAQAQQAAMAPPHAQDLPARPLAPATPRAT